MAGQDKAAIAYSIAIVAIFLGIAASIGIAQDAGPRVSAPPTVSTESSQSDSSMIEEEEVMMEEEEVMMEEGVKMDGEDMMEEEEEVMMEEEEEVMMEEEEVMMEEPAGPTTHHVEIPVGTSVPGCEVDNSCWSPADITINAGDTVHWMNVDTAAHTVTGGSPADGPSGVFDSSLVMADAVYAFTFDETGSYDYFCMVHPWMVGTVTVN